MKEFWGGEELTMTSGGDSELPSREEVAAATSTVVMEVDSSSAVTLAQEGVVGEDLVTVVEAGGGVEAAASANEGVEAVGDASESEAARGGFSGLATGSRDTLGSGGDATSSREGATGTPDTPK
ncbi:hypothetical protein RHMOL_Rhmol06G0102900 [Rhododendron molle]|uniref:Uncharacterized protein n=1 Tax=Rhododendron molle TaxID=49168 RepID=A0ACC0NB04_RHOML|nr:hypothetical protein RHMOL_Rhmol06G0102900 [Rhododendron molle]